MISKLLSLFRQRWLYSGLGLVILALLIWHAGPLVSVAGYEPLGPSLHRWIAIGILVTAWVVGRVRAMLKAHKTERRMLEGIVSAAPPPPDYKAQQSAEEIAALAERFQEAIEVLRKSRDKRWLGKKYLYELPWYVLIGPPGSGKTTALIHSDLRFPLAERFGQDPIGGIGGTRNCDWWFTDEAILLDTAGRYFTQDSQAEIDRAAWIGFLDLLKAHRPRRPINGAIVAISVPDLLMQSEAERALHIRAIRERIQELHKQLGVSFPVYLLLTKCDLLAGFMEFFDDLGREERAQVWGMTFALGPDRESKAELEQFALEFDLLSERLGQRLVSRLQEERDPARRDLIFGFPQQFASVRQTAQSFLKGAFEASRFEFRPMLRGVYFSSGTQEGTPIDRVMGSLARRLGLSARSLPRFSGHGRSYFVTRLLKDVIFPEAGLAGANIKLERRQAWLQRTAYVGAVCLSLLVAAGWAYSYAGNKRFVETVAREASAVEEQVQNLSPHERRPESLLPLLNNARNITGGPWTDDIGMQPLMRLGLYQGSKLGPQVREIYRRVLEGAFLPRLMFRLEEQIRQGMGEPEYLYNALRIYLMLANPDQLRPEEVEAWIGLDWERNLQREFDQERRQQLLSHLRALLERSVTPLPIALDQALVDRARDVLARTSPAERIYARFKRGPGARNLEPFRLSDAVGPGGATVFQRPSGRSLSEPLDGLFTYQGYRDVFETKFLSLAKEAAEESWVLGKDATIDLASAEFADLTNQVRELYLTDYGNHWESLVWDIDIVPLSSLEDAVRVIRILSAEDSPLLRLLTTLEKETALQTRSAQSPSVTQGAGDRLRELRDRFADILPGSSERKISEPAVLNPVEQRFAGLHALVRANEEGGPIPLERTLNRLYELYVALSELANVPPAQRPARTQEILRDAVSQLKLDAEGQPEPLGKLLNDLATNATITVSGDVRGQLNRLWQTTGLDFYRKALSGRYPLSSGSRREATLEDFGAFFGPGGLVDAFFKEHLSNHVDTSRRQWALNRGAPAISAEALRQFQLAAKIRDEFFRAGASSPSVQFQLKPITMDVAATQFLLDLDGQKVTYRHDPPRPASLQWPAPNPTGQVSVRFVPAAELGPSGLTEDGPWAWFRVLDQARIEATDLPERYLLRFEVGGRWAQYELRASSAFNPFNRSALEQFRCPERL